MTTTIYYFTGTGNSLVVARTLAEHLDAQLVPIKGAIQSETVAQGIVGIVFPVYMYNAPAIVYEFIRKIKTCEYLFVVMTMGAESGKTLARLKKISAANGVEVNAGFSIMMPDNYIPWNSAADPDRQNKLFGTMQSKIPQIVTIVKNKQPHTDDEKEFDATLVSPAPFPFNLLPGWAVQGLFDMGYRFIKKMDASFVAGDRCNGCGICAKICPVGNITISNKKPLWQHNCEQCFACLQWCPQVAIEYGKKTAGRERYHHPEVGIKDLAG